MPTGNQYYFATDFSRARVLPCCLLKQPGLKCMGLNVSFIYDDINPILVYFHPHSEERGRSQLYQLSMAYPQLLLEHVIVLCSSCMLCKTFTIKRVTSYSPPVTTTFTIVTREVNTGSSHTCAYAARIQREILGYILYRGCICMRMLCITRTACKGKYRDFYNCSKEITT